MAYEAIQPDFDPVRGPLVSSAAAGSWILVTGERVRQLSDEGWFPKIGRDQFYLGDVVKGYIRFRNGSDRRIHKSAADNRVRAARAREIELRNEQALGRLVPLETFQAFVDLLCGIFRSELGGMPARLTRDLVLRRQAEREAYGILERIAAFVAEHIGRLEAGAAVANAVAGDDAGSVGGEQSDLSAIGGAAGSA